MASRGASLAEPGLVARPGGGSYARLFLAMWSRMAE